MVTRNLGLTRPGIFTVAIFFWALLLLPATDARAITFGEWADQPRLARRLRHAGHRVCVERIHRQPRRHRQLRLDDNTDHDPVFVRQPDHEHRIGRLQRAGQLDDPGFVLQPNHEHRIGRLQRAGQLDDPGFGLQPNHEHRIGRLQRAGQLDVPVFGRQPDHEHRIGRLHRAGQPDDAGFVRQPDHEHRIGRLHRAGQLDARWIWTPTKSRASNRATSPGWAA